MKDTLNKIKSILSNALSKLADCIVPTAPILIGAGMLKVLLIILGPLVLNILKEDSSTYIVLSFVADAGYYFMPIFTAIASADVFKVNKYLAALMGAILLSPTFINLVDQNYKLSIYGLPITNTKYASQVISSVIIVWLMSYVYHFLDNHLHKNIKDIVLPLLTILIMTPIALVFVGPLGVILGNKLVDLILYLKDLGPIGNAIMGALIPYTVITGLGGANLSAMLLLASSGCDPILFFANVIYNNVLGFVSLAIYFKKKESKALSGAITAAVAGTSEHVLFGIVLKDIKALISLTIGCFFGGLYAGLTGVKAYAMASFGIFGIVSTIGPDSSILNAAIAIIIGCSIGFILTFITIKNEN